MQTKEKMIAIIIAIAFMPISLYTSGLLDISGAILICLAGVIFVFRKGNSVFEITFWLSILTWTLLYLTTSIISGNFDLRKIASFSYLMLPFFGYYAGKKMVEKFKDRFLDYFLQMYSIFYAIFIIFVLISILYTRSSVRIGSTNFDGQTLIYGDKIGFSDIPFKLYGSWGIHSFIDLIAINLIILLYVLIKHRHNLMTRLLYISGIISTIYMILFSFSREGWIMLFVVSIYFAFKSIGKSPFRSILSILTLLIGGLIFSNSISNSFFIERQATIISEGNVNDLSSGRFSIVMDGIKYIADHPASGAITGSQDLSYTTNTSLHNQLLTYLYKLGLISGFFLVVHVILIHYRVLHRNKSVNRFRQLMEYVVVSLLVLSLFWDILLVNHIGTLVLFLCGAISNSGGELHDPKVKKVSY